MKKKYSKSNVVKKDLVKYKMFTSDESFIKDDKMVNKFIQMLMPWKKQAINLRISLENKFNSNLEFKSAVEKLANGLQIINTKIDFYPEVNLFRSSKNDINVCHLRTKLGKPEIIINEKERSLLICDVWNDPFLCYTKFANTLIDVTSDLFNVFFSFFFNHVKSNQVNIYTNIQMKEKTYEKELFTVIKRLKVFYNGQRVKFNCKPIRSAVHFQENDVLIQSLYNFSTLDRAEALKILITLSECVPKPCVISYIKVKDLVVEDLNVKDLDVINSNVNVAFVELIDTSESCLQVQRLTELFQLFSGITIYL